MYVRAYRAYLFFGDPFTKEFADTWLYHDYWRSFAETADPRQVPLRWR